MGSLQYHPYLFAGEEEAKGLADISPRTHPHFWPSALSFGVRNIWALPFGRSPFGRREYWALEYLGVAV